MAGLVTTFGAGAMTNAISEIRDADFLLVTGSNTTEAHPIIGMEMKRAVRRGAKLVVCDPRAIFLTTIAHRHLALRPGTDVWLLNAMAHVIIAEDLYDHAFVETHTEGFDRVREVVGRYPPKKAAAVCGVEAEAIRRTAREYATTDRAGIYYTLGITEHTHGTDNVYALSNLVLLTGHLGRRSVGLNPLRGQNNVQGANDAGASPIFFPGYQRVDDDEVRARYEASWGVSLPSRPGMNLNVMVKELGETIRGVFCMGEDLAVSEPNAQRVEAGLEALDFLVVQDIFLNETARFADVVLPAACFAEKDGLFTNSERRVQRVRKAVEPPGEARPDWEILVELARRAGQEWRYGSASEVYDEMVRDAPKFRGISHARIDAEGVGFQWPCPDADHPGTGFLHEGKVLRGRGRFMPVEYRPSKEQPDTEYPLLLSTGRTLYHYNAATQTRRSEGTHQKQPEPFCEVHVEDAAARGVATGDAISVRTRRGQLTCRAIISRQVRPGRIWMPLHFKEARANLLTQDAGDPITQTAEFKVCAAEVERVVDDRPAARFPGSFYDAAGPVPGRPGG